MTLITETHGGVTRRCDATCHRAKKPKCRCICDGKHHGPGDAMAKTVHDRDRQPVAEVLQRATEQERREP